MLLLLVVVGLLGLAVGSFLNVVIWRVPRGESVVAPPSACPRCGRQIRARDNVPVVSWLLLRARCRDCGEPISVRYPLVEAGTAVLFVLAAVVVGFSWTLPVALYFVSIAVALTLIDVDVKRLPNAIVLPSYVVVAVLLVLASWNPGGESDWSALLGAALGCLALLAVYVALAVASGGRMGLGDVKLAGVLGLLLGWVGWPAVVTGWFAAFLLGGLFSVALLLAGRATRKSGVPFGPWMFAGAAVGLVLGGDAWTWYSSLL